MHRLGHIIVVHDDAVLRARLRRATTTTHPHASVTVTTSSERGLLAYHQLGADLLIIGSNMLQHGGHKLVQAVKSGHDHTPILMLCDTRTTSQDALAAGASAVLQAPIVYQQLLKQLAEVLPPRPGKAQLHAAHQDWYSVGRPA